MNLALELVAVRKSFVSRRSLLGRPVDVVHAVRDVDLTVAPGEAVALVGESGSGKSTTGRMALALLRPDAGTVSVFGEDLARLGGADLRRLRSRARMVFQDPFSSLNPRRRVGQLVTQPLVTHGQVTRGAWRTAAEDLLESVGLQAHHADRFPYQMSGGQLQRVAIARAIATDPALVVCDEPVAALDMSVRAQILDLLVQLQSDRELSMLFISHDLAVVRQVADRVAVMTQGALVEVGPTEQIFEDPQADYTRDLLAAMPTPDPDRRAARLASAQAAMAAATVEQAS